MARMTVRSTLRARPRDRRASRPSFLIQPLVRGSDASVRLRTWIQDGRTNAMSTLAWGEFLCEPLSDQVETVAHRIVRVHVPLATDEAAAGARLFNETGRRRGPGPWSSGRRDMGPKMRMRARCGQREGWRP